MKIVRRIGYFILTVILLLLAGYVFFIYNAESLIKEFVFKESKGKMRLEIGKLHFYPMEARLTIIRPHFLFTDSIHQPSTFDIKADKITLELASLKDLLFRKQIEVDSITFLRPHIKVTQWQEIKSEKFSLPEQMEKAYNFLNISLSKMSIDYCLIDSGAFTLIDKVHPENGILSVTDYYCLIDQMHLKKDNNADKRLFYADRIKFYSSRQKISLNNGNQQLSFSRLRMNSKNKLIELDSCFIFNKKNKSEFNQFSGFFDTLKFTNVDFLKLTHENIIKADSVYCINPHLELHTTIKNKSVTHNGIKPPMGKDSLIYTVKYLLGNIDIKYIAVVNASLSLLTKKNEKISNYQVKRTDFSMNEVVVINQPDIPIQVGKFDLGIVGYQSSISDSTYIVKFDSIHFLNDQLSLSNFSITPTAKNNYRNEHKDISMKSLRIKNISWPDIIANNVLIAQEIELNEPVMNITVPYSDSAHPAKKSNTLLQLLQKNASFINVQQLAISHAALNYFFNRTNALRLADLNTSISVNQLFQAQDFNSIASSANSLSFASGDLTLNKQKILLLKGKYLGPNKFVQFEKLQYMSTDNKTKASLSTVRLNQLSFTKENHFYIGSIKWDKADLFLIENKSSAKKKDSPPVFIQIDSMSGRNTLLDINAGNKIAKGSISTFGFIGFSWDSQLAPVVKEVKMEGEYFSFSDKTLLFKTKNFSFIHNGNSFVNNISIVSNQAFNKLDIQIPKVSFIPDINSIFQKTNSFDNFVIFNPTVNLLKGKDSLVGIKNKLVANFPQLKINSLNIHQPNIVGFTIKGNGNIVMENLNTDILLSGIHSDSNKIEIKKLKWSLSDFSYTSPSVSVSVPSSSVLDVTLSNILLKRTPQKNAINWEAKLDALKVNDCSISTFKNDTINTAIAITSLDLANLKIDGSKKLDAKTILDYNPQLSLKNTFLSFKNPKKTIAVHNLSLLMNSNEIKFDSVNIHPNLDKYSYIKNSIWQKDYPNISFGQTTIEGFDIDNYFSDTIFHFKNVSTSSKIYIYKDKTYPFQHGIIKPLPVSLLQQIKAKFLIDNMVLDHTNITYEELNEKTLKNGVVAFSDLTIRLKNIKNVGLLPTDSLSVTASGNFMEDVHFKFKFKEGYLDSLHAFTLGISVRPFDFKILNPILEPLASVRIVKGSLDTLSLFAIGREFVSRGKIKMFYKNLKIQYLNKGIDSLSNFKTRLITFLANDLLLKRNNENKYGEVFYERDREKGFTNYWVKILLSGVVSSTGIKTNKKVINRYKSRIKKFNLPVIPDVTL